MSGRLTFSRASVRRCLIHAQESEKHRLAYSQSFNGATQTGAGLWLVKDEGVYLLSNGDPADKIDGAGDSLFVAYAKEANPLDPDQEFDDWWGAGREIMGPDDCVEYLSLDLFAPWRAAKGDLCIDVTDSDIMLAFGE